MYGMTFFDTSLQATALIAAVPERSENVQKSVVARERRYLVWVVFAIKRFCHLDA